MSTLIEKLYNPLKILWETLNRNMVSVLVTCATSFMVLGSGFVVVGFNNHNWDWGMLGVFLFVGAIIFYVLGINHAKKDEELNEKRHQELLSAIKNINNL
jgi:hypothetical protein